MGISQKRKKITPVVTNVNAVVPEAVQLPAPKVPQRIRSVANIEAEARYKEKKKAEAKAKKEAEAAELARPLPEQWVKNRAELQQSNLERFQELSKVDEEVGDLLYWVRNIEEGVKNHLV